MKAIRQKELLCLFIFNYMRTMEDYDPEDLDGNKKDRIPELKEIYGLTDKEIKEINKWGKDMGIGKIHGQQFPVICNI